ncbi:SMP-30/gluconolactonase/LRE family protein [Sulfitobacter geojensis]|uniref:SMP-30/gluconolactonase/LRE family protein n=1 Tax=Sulfitobacter geojensis TaxID=1342299 RepID=UPI00046B02D4|nr:SMP-30/gluconolactonase/LRE family protein [Sulfitobacter geojensis]KHA51682.1 Antibiotic induced protein, Drp35 [Sulfitobacter geojensis]NYI29097.1 gluconolactonase [Sulfitobacter geojensis]
MTLTKVCEGLDFPEGPIAMADGSVILVEIRRQTLSRVLPDGTITVIAELGGGPNGAAIGPDGMVYVCNNGGFIWTQEGGITRPIGTPEDYVTGSIQRVDPETGAFETIYDSCDGIPLRGPNDIVFDAEGGFYFTDLGKSNAEFVHHGAFYYAKADGSRITRVHAPMITPNGIGLSPDDKTVHVAETRTGRVWSFDLIAPGKIAPLPFDMPGRLEATLPDYQLLDSLAVQADGKICVATLMRGGISTVPVGDGPVTFFEVPGDPYITNICFGGEDMRDAWITASGTGCLYHTRWPDAGHRLHFNG